MQEERNLKEEKGLMELLHLTEDPWMKKYVLYDIKKNSSQEGAEVSLRVQCKFEICIKTNRKVQAVICWEYVCHRYGQKISTDQNVLFVHDSLYLRVRNNYGQLQTIIFTFEKQQIPLQLLTGNVFINSYSNSWKTSHFPVMA